MNIPRRHTHLLWNTFGLILYMGAQFWHLLDDDAPLWLVNSLVVLGIVCLVYGLSRQAIHRGYHFAWGLLGLTGVLGWVVVSLLPDRRAAHRT